MHHIERHGPPGLASFSPPCRPYHREKGGLRLQVNVFDGKIAHIQSSRFIDCREQAVHNNNYEVTALGRNIMVAITIRPIEVEAKGGLVSIDAINLSKSGHPFMGPHPIFKKRRASWDETGAFRSGGAPDGRFDLSGTPDADQALSELQHAWRSLTGQTETKPLVSD